ncbi:hypothetical protein U9M48_030962 [Paspalum notatum var. saurae]|uniref:Uncharacterized protein n=1 Tax=Paspalum notatum var. saurae TaxID=547442 RepID=A0AAQ3U1U8_PASNO
MHACRTPPDAPRAWLPPLAAPLATDRHTAHLLQPLAAVAARRLAPIAACPPSPRRARLAAAAGRALGSRRRAACRRCAAHWGHAPSPRRSLWPRADAAPPAVASMWKRGGLGRTGTLAWRTRSGAAARLPPGRAARARWMPTRGTPAWRRRKGMPAWWTRSGPSATAAPTAAPRALSSARHRREVDARTGDAGVEEDGERGGSRRRHAGAGGSRRAGAGGSRHGSVRRRPTPVVPGGGAVVAASLEPQEMERVGKVGSGKVEGDWELGVGGESK